MARTNKDPLKDLKLRVIPGVADEQGTGRAKAGVEVKKGNLTAELFYRIDENGFRWQWLKLFGDDIKPGDLRLPLTSIREWVVEQIQKRPDVMSIAAMLGDEGQKAAVEKAFRMLDEPGQGVHNDEHWAWIAEEYLLACQVSPSTPINYMKRELEKREIFWSRDKVASEKEQAKQYGWLVSKGTPGKAGADPGPKLIQWRKDHE